MDEKETCPRDGFGKILQGQVSEDDQRTISYGPYALRTILLKYIFRTEKDSETNGESRK